MKNCAPLLKLVLLAFLSLLLNGCFQAQLNGPVASTNVTLTELNSEQVIATADSWDADFVIAATDQESWDNFGATQQLWFLGVFTLDSSTLADDTYYLLSASGGSDFDSDTDRLIDAEGTEVVGTWHAIMTGEQAKQLGPKVSVLTEAIYQNLLPDLPNLMPSDLTAQLNTIAQRLVDDVNDDGSVTYDDALLWSQLFDAGAFLGDPIALSDLGDAIASDSGNFSGLSEALLNSGKVSAGNGWKLFDIDEIRTEHANAGSSYYQFINESTMSMGLYTLEATDTDGQSVPGQDAIYYILGGNAKLQAEGIDYDASAGAIIYVKAGVSRQIHSVTERLETMVLFSKTASVAGDASVQSNTISGVSGGRNPSQNVWNPFLNKSTMTFGMYLLPQIRGGDGFLTHQTDEINILVNGSSHFNIGNEIIDVEPGSIFFVDEGFAHNFQNVQADTDVLIFWNK
jgi:mannose-6-phosphate isomerase-like protein (cupin superfamily)